MHSEHSSPTNLKRAPAGEQARVLVVDDEPLVRRWVERVLVDCGYAVDAVNDGAAAVASLHQHRYDLVLTDITMPRLDGLGVLAAVTQHDARLPVVLMTGAPPEGLVLRANELGAVLVLIKPMPLDAIVESIGRWVRLNRLQQLAAQSRSFLFADASSPRTPRDLSPILQQLGLLKVKPQRALLASQLLTVGPGALVPEAVLLDPELVSGMETATDALALARSLIVLCADLALPLIALDVQTPEAERALRDAGCTLFHPAP